jgi:hypothetical protein
LSPPAAISTPPRTNRATVVTQGIADLALCDAGDAFTGHLLFLCAGSRTVSGSYPITLEIRVG